MMFKNVILVRCRQLFTELTFPEAKFSFKLNNLMIFILGAKSYYPRGPIIRKRHLLTPEMHETGGF